MPYLLIPHEATSDRAAIWVGALGEDPARAALTLRSEAGELQLDPAAWQSWPPEASPKLRYQTVTLTNLAPGTTLHLDLRDGQASRATAAVTTLPLRLPAAHESPFTVFLGSCFCQRNDQAGEAGNTYAHLPADCRPTIKIFCGDQVYLDDPAESFTLAFHNQRELESLFFQNYQRTWTQHDYLSGFMEILKEGANFFCSDDHELWNNAPNRAPYLSDTWTAGGRRKWSEAAKALYHIFQTSPGIQQFSVGSLSFLIADTRLDRTTDRAQFMPPQHLDQVRAWIEQLPGPGVLVIGQPIFTDRTNFLSGTFVDWTLADYQQYGPLAGAILSSKHSIVVLTGDVHFGRVASCRLNDLDPAGAQLIEVISSPLSLVNKVAKGRWEQAPALFPAFEIPGLNRRPVTTDQNFRLNDNHFLTLRFFEEGARIRMSLTAWPISGGALPREVQISEQFSLI